MYHAIWTDANYKPIRNEMIASPEGKGTLVRRLGDQYLREIQNKNPGNQFKLIVTARAAVVTGASGFMGAVSVEAYYGEACDRILNWLAGHDDIDDG